MTYPLKLVVLAIGGGSIGAGSVYLTGWLLSDWQLWATIIPLNLFWVWFVNAFISSARPGE